MNGGSVASQIFTVLTLLVGFGVILYLAYICTKFLGKRFSLKGTASGNIKVLESINAGQGKTIAIVSAGDKIILLGITSENINFLCELNRESINFSDNSNLSGMEFSKAFKQALETKFGKKKTGEKNNEDRQ